MSQLPVLRTEDCLDLRLPSDPQISPTGDWVAYVRRRVDRQADVWAEGVCVVHIGTGQSVELGPGEAPRWASDGATLAYVRSGPLGHHICRWRCEEPSEEPCVLARLEEAPQGLAWSPDGRELAFTLFVPDPAAAPLERDSPWEALRTDAWARPPVVTDRLVRRVDGVAEELRPGHHHIFLLDIATGVVRQLTSGPWNHGGPLTKLTKLQLAGRISWAPEGRHIVMSMQRAEHDATRPDASPIASGIYEFDVGSGAVRGLMEFGGPACQATVSPDGRWIAFVGFRDVGKAFHTSVVHIVPRQGGEPRALPHPEGLEVHATIQWWPDSRGVLAVLPHRGAGCLVSVDLDGHWQTLSRDVGGSAALGYVTVERDFSISRSGAIAYLQGSSASTDEVAVLNPAAGVARRLTCERAWLDGRDLAEVEEIELTCSGLPLQGWLLRPPTSAAEAKPPVILWLHGGPYMAWGPDFALAPQLWASRGYAVLMINPRGSLGYGESFTDALHHDFPGPDDLVLLDAVDEVVERWGLDGSRVFVAGESGGAVLTAWLISHSTRFKAAAMLFGVVDWASMALTADRCDYFPRYWFPAAPTASGMREHYWRRSPLSVVDKVRTPTLLLCGDQDWRTPLAQSEMYYTALKMQGTEAVLGRFPGACHGLDGRPSQQMATIDLVQGWFGRFCGNECQA